MYLIEKKSDLILIKTELEKWDYEWFLDLIFNIFIYLLR